MLTVSRKDGQKVLIGKDIEVSVRHGRDGQIKVSVEAPRDIKILREELLKTSTDTQGAR